MRWMAPTMKDALGGEGNPLVTCACGRRTNADMLVDLRGLPPGLRARAQERAGQEFACDACRSRAIRLRRVTREEVMRALGAPPEVLERIRARSRTPPS